MECPTALCSVAGATTVTSPSFCNSFRKARKPGAKMPSSLVSRIRTPTSCCRLPRLRGGLGVGGELFAPQNVVVMLGEAVGLVADVLEQPQGRRVPAEAQGLGGVGPEDLLLALGQREQLRRRDAQKRERFLGRVQ